MQDQLTNPELMKWARVIDLLVDEDADTKITLDNAGVDSDVITLTCDSNATLKVEKTVVTMTQTVKPTAPRPRTARWS